MNKKALDIDDIRRIISEESECRLISNEYNNADSLLTLMCGCKDVFVVKYRYFKYQNKRMCNKCTNRKNGIVNDIESAKYLVNKLSKGQCEIISDVYIDNKTPMNILCHCGKYFCCSITNIKQKKIVQCKDCAYDLFRMTSRDIEKMGDMHGCKILNIDDYKNENSILDFNCPCGNVFTRTLASFKANNKECLECSRDKMSENQRLDFEVIKRESLRYGCPVVSAREDYINQNSKLIFCCGCGSNFERSISNFRRLAKSCPSCTSSKGETEIARVLSEKSMKFKQEYMFKGLVSDLGNKLRFDFAVSNEFKKPFLIEYDGEFHYKALISEELFEKQKYHDELKNEYCLKNNIPLLRIPYFEYENIETIITEFICKLMPR